MKKLFYVVLLLLGMGIMAGSCSKVKTDIYSASIIGSWQAYKVVDYDGNTATQGADDETVYFTFTENGKFFIEEIDSDGEYDGYQTGDYRIEGSTLFFSAEGAAEGWKIEKLTKTELVFGVMDGDVAKMYFKKVGQRDISDLL